jgi:hypothetical protein
MDAALALHAAGCCPIPAKTDGSKAPAGFWREFQGRRPEPGEMSAWFDSPGAVGIGVVCGAVSGGLEMLEWEARAMHLLPDAVALMVAAGLADLWNRIIGGYVEFSPSGGIHVLYRVDGAPVPGNTKLANRPSTPEELATWKVKERAKNVVTLDRTEAMCEKREEQIKKATEDDVPQVLIETRGEGGFVVVAPSNGSTHPSGLPWKMHVGSPATIPTITAAEHTALWDVAKVFDKMPVAPPKPPPPVASGLAPTSPATVKTAAEGIPPGEAWAEATKWLDILDPYGWTHVRTDSAGTSFWLRPGKDVGVSATTGYGADTLVVFSTSTEFVARQAYTKFGAYTLLNHGGDYAAAARSLRALGYGSPQVSSVAPRLNEFNPPNVSAAVGDGAAPPIPVIIRAKILTRTQLAGLPAPEPLIEGTLDRRTLTVLAGYWGTGKTFIALDWACSIAAGRRWQGRPTVTPLGTSVLYVAAEGAYGLAQRVDSWEQGWGADAASLYVLPQPVNLFTGEGLAILCEFIVEYRPALVVVDTVARCAVGADENSAKDMGVVVRSLDAIREATGDGSVLAVHHTGKDKTTVRGSSALEASADTVYITEGDATFISLSRTKRKDGPTEDALTLKLVNISRSCVVESLNENLMRFSPVGDVAAEILRDVFGIFGASRAQLRDACMDHGMSRASAYRAMKELVSMGEATVDGSSHKAWYSPVDKPKISASQDRLTEISGPGRKVSPPPLLKGVRRDDAETNETDEQGDVEDSDLDDEDDE